MRILVTGGCGFIASNFLNIFVNRYPKHSFLNVDKLDYNADIQNVTVRDASNYFFSKTDILNLKRLEEIFYLFQPDWIIHAAAKSHVDYSYSHPVETINTNVNGTLNLLECCRKYWKNNDNKIFYLMSTDEVYGEAEDGIQFTENTPYRPNTPYAASKASANHLSYIYYKNYGLPVRIGCCSNNYGANQHIEKFVPRTIYRILHGETITIHADGSHVRDWLYVDDHCEAVWTILQDGYDGELYNIGGNNERTILRTAEIICQALAKYTDMPYHALIQQIEYVADRPANDHRYSIDPSKIRQHLGWQSQTGLEEGFDRTVRHYLDRFK
jgi:dTDP-glucose 4,6-dehydratase